MPRKTVSQAYGPTHTWGCVPHRGDLEPTPEHRLRELMPTNRIRPRVDRQVPGREQPEPLPLLAEGIGISGDDRYCHLKRSGFRENVLMLIIGYVPPEDLPQDRSPEHRVEGNRDRDAPRRALLPSTHWVRQKPRNLLLQGRPGEGRLPALDADVVALAFLAGLGTGIDP